MEVQYVSLKCPTCGNTSNWYHHADRDVYECLHCGNFVERQEKKETVTQANTIIRQALQDIAYGRMSSARDNLIECERLDAEYIGTTIASLAYEMYRLREDISAGEKRSAMAQMKKHFAQLCAGGQYPGEEEREVYEALGSAEAFGVLVLVYDSVNLTERRDWLLERLHVDEVYSSSLHADLIRFATQNERYGMLDSLSKNTASMDSHQAVRTMLMQYPDGAQKRENVSRLIRDGRWEQEDARLFTTYLNESQDDLQTLFTVALAVADKPCCPPMESLIERVLSKLTADEQAIALVNALTEGKLPDAQLYMLLSYALESGSDAVCLCMLRRLAQTGHFVEFTHKHFVTLLSRRTSAAMKKQMMEAALAFRVQENLKERVIGSYLCQIEDDPAVRKELLPYLFTLVPTLPTDTVKSYLLAKGREGEDKADIVRQILSMKINRSLYRDVPAQYMKQSADETAVKSRVLWTMFEADLPLSQEACAAMLTAQTPTETKIRLLRRLRENGLRYGDVAKDYMTMCTIHTFDQLVWEELMLHTADVSESMMTKYVLLMPAPAQRKAGTVAAMLRGCFNPSVRIGCKVRHNNNTVECNLLQAYILVGTEAPTEAAVVLRALGGAKPELNGDVTVGGQSMRFKKYIASQKQTLSPTTAKLCAEQRLL